jgi:hypothetical protein
MYSAIEIRGDAEARRGTNGAENGDKEGVEEGSEGVERLIASFVDLIATLGCSLAAGGIVIFSIAGLRSDGICEFDIVDEAE